MEAHIHKHTNEIDGNANPLIYYLYPPELRDHMTFESLNKST